MFQSLISYGSNLDGPFGSPRETIDRALDEIKTDNLILVKKSRDYSSAAFPDKTKPRYVNGCIEIRVKMKPQQLLCHLKFIERKMGRIHSKRWDSRICDLDLLSFDDIVYPNEAEFNYWRKLDPEQQSSQKPEKLLLPHPRIQDRAFVLKPLLEIAPRWIHPVLKMSVREMLQDLPTAELRDVTSILN
tara:strand:- start:85 stop:648 length:564 start_codon:yes stop_codon:yes gene_type:complete